MQAPQIRGHAGPTELNMDSCRDGATEFRSCGATETNMSPGRAWRQTRSFTSKLNYLQRCYIYRMMQHPRC